MYHSPRTETKMERRTEKYEEQTPCRDVLLEVNNSTAAAMNMMLQVYPFPLYPLTILAGRERAKNERLPCIDLQDKGHVQSTRLLEKRITNSQIQVRNCTVYIYCTRGITK